MTAAASWAAGVAASPASAPAAERAAALLGEPHHDGSALYVVERPDAPGDRATVRLRVPRVGGAGSVFVRYWQDGEACFAPAEVDVRTEAETWWRASFPVWSSPTRYRWLLTGGHRGYAWLNGTGVSRHDPTDAGDFVIAPGPEGPEWHLSGVVYEIFPDRFASSRLAVEPPGWALPRSWDARPSGAGPEAALEWFGGDLRGVEQRLDHLTRLGATALFLRSVFPAGSTHRYDATSFERIDPLLGGTPAFASLVRAARARGLRLIGDLTTNHTGDGHDWFRAARADASAPERDFYYFDASLAAGYEAWWDVATLPKLDWSSERLRERMAAVVRHWLAAGLDGWRIDAANMTGRRRSQDLHREVARLLRQAAGDALLIAEHCHDFRGDVTGDGWHGATNYAGFTRPVWQWLRGEELPARADSQSVPGGLPRLDGPAIEATMRAFRAGTPWSAVLHSWSLLDSCDSARFRTVAGSRERHLVGLGLQMTLPGVPVVCAGDELGLEGEWGEDGRRTMPWERPERWDRVLEDGYRAMIALRRRSPALQRGGIRAVYVDPDVIAFLREGLDERVLVLASRGGESEVRVPISALGACETETLYGRDARIEDGYLVLPAEGPAFHAWRLS
jgi:alpha-glucosidase